MRRNASRKYGAFGLIGHLTIGLMHCVEIDFDCRIGGKISRFVTVCHGIINTVYNKRGTLAANPYSRDRQESLFAG